MRRKTILLGLVFVFVFVMFIAFTGCQSSNKDQQKAKTEADISVTDDSQNGNDKKVTLSLVHWDMGENPTITKQLEAFNKHKPNIQVNVTVEPWEQY